MKEHVNRFSKGVNADIAKVSSAYSETMLDALNMRVLTELGQSSFAVENVKGNILSHSFTGVSNTVMISTTDGFASGLLSAATNFTVDIQYTIGTIDIQLLFTITSGDPTWPILPFDNALSFYQWLATHINSNATGYDIKAYFDEDGVYLAYLKGTTTISINLTADADWTFGPLGDPSNPDVTYTDYTPVTTGLKVIGSGTIRDKIILFTTNETIDSPTASLGQIWLMEIDNTSLLSNVTLLYNDYINLTTAHPIQAIGRYENETIQRIYWTDNYNYVRSFNIVDSNAFALRPDVLNLFPSTSFTPAILKAVTTGGSLDVGVYQLGYRLSRKSGTSTTIAMLSNLVPVYRLEESTIDYSNIQGEDLATPQVPTGKRILWDIINVDNDFDYLQPIVVKRLTYTGSPTVYLLDLIPIGTSTQVSVDYSGLENKEEITLEEFLLLSSNFFDTCKTITSSANSMLVGNIKTSKRFDADFDARAYSFNTIGSGATSYVTPDLSDTATWGIPLDEDVINPDNADPSVILDYHFTPNKFKYQSDGVTLGGEGPNIKYRFVTKSLLEDKRVNLQTGNQINTKNYLDPRTRITSSEVLNDYTYDITQALPNHKSAYISGLYRGYKRGETYRFGIVFYDKRGNPGFVKWIADIRFPRIAENNGDPLAIQGGDASGEGVSTHNYELVTHNFTTKETYTNQLGIEFTVNIPTALSDLIKGYSIVRVKRELKDRTVLANGYIGAVQDRGTFDAHPGLVSSVSTVPSQNCPDVGSTGAASVVGAARKESILFYSPEYQFARNTDIIPKASLLTDYIYTDAYLAQLHSTQDRDPLNNDFWINKLYYNYTTVNGGTVNLGPFNASVGRSYYNPLRSATIVARNTNVNQQGPAYFIYTGSAPFYNEAQRANNTTIAEGGLTMLLGLQSPSAGVPQMIFYQTHGGFIDAKLGAVSNAAKYIGDICRIVTDQYGGKGYEARALNEYISCGHYQAVNYSASNQTFTSTVFGGDTFVNIWSCNKLIPHNATGTGWITASAPGAQSWTAYLPVESYINTHLRHDEHDNRVPCPLAEERFLYNSVYSCENDIIKYFPKPSASSFNEVDEFDTRIYASDIKVNGEISDSWSVFRQSNYLDLDGAYGPINNLVPYGSTVIAFQDNALAQLSIAPRFVIREAIGTEEALLGTGKTLESYNYISIGSGAKHQWGITKGVYAGIESIYYFDAYRKSLYRLTGSQIMPLIGQDSLLRSFARGAILDQDNPIAGYGVCCTYDTVYNEAWFTFRTSKLLSRFEGIESLATEEEDVLTLSYSAPIQAFNGRYSFTPRIYVSNVDRVLSSLEGLDLYLHHYGNYAQFYGTTYDSSVKFIINPEPLLRKTLASIGYIGEVIDEDGYNIGDETFTRARVYNDYQNTDYINLSTNATRKERMWSINALRDVVLNPNSDIFDPTNSIATLPATDLRVQFPQRLRDFYFIAELLYNNANNNKIVLPYVKSIYNVSPR